jgi:L-ascorbate metabolism protein UlaG (beta-lactamase superfamily)
MRLQLIRNATLVLDYGGQRFLIDPMLGPAHAFESYGGISENPTVGLSIPAQDVLADIDAVIVSHLHKDHFDAAAQELLPKDWPLLCQPDALERIEALGFLQARPVIDPVEWKGIRISPTSGEHGYGVWIERMGPVSGYLFEAAGEPSLYWAGDTVLTAGVRDLILEHQPDCIVTHSGGAWFESAESLIIMGVKQTLEAARLAPHAQVIAVHLEALDHCPVTRQELALAARQAGLADRIRIPADGEVLDP